jgi:dinuclear metal center YbgI/SA1388 family protein
MITLQEISLYLQNLLSPGQFTDYCPNGIQVEGKHQIKRICFAVSASLAVIEEAVKQKADALIVHHGIFWNKEPLSVTGTKRDKLHLLLKNDISLLAYHLPLDAHQSIGNNWKAAHDLGMGHLESFAEIGVKGTFTPIAVDVFCKKLEAYYGHPAHVALGGKEKISSAAIISGGAHRFITQAADEGIDCFITGSFDEPIWDIAHERKMHFMALGHYSTERIGILALMEAIEKKMDVSCTFIDFFNPF